MHGGTLLTKASLIIVSHPGMVGLSTLPALGHRCLGHRRRTVDKLGGKSVRPDNFYNNYKKNCSHKAVQMHERPVRAVKNHMQPLAAINFVWPNSKKDLVSRWFIIPAWAPLWRIQRNIK